MKQKRTTLSLALALAGCALAGYADETLPSWTYYETNTVGSAHPGVSYITDGTWKIRATPYKGSATELLITTGGARTNAFWAGLPTTTDTLDLRGLITSPDGSKTNIITHIDQFSLGADGLKEPSTPKRFIAPTTLNCGLYGWFNGFRCDVGDTKDEYTSAYTNITIHVPGWFETINVNQRPKTDGSLDWDLYLPCLRKICSWSLVARGDGATCNKSTYGVLTAGAFKELQTVQSQVFPNAMFSGVLDLPSLTWADNWSMNGCSPGFVEAKIAAEKACCAYLGTGCLGWNYKMTNVVLGLCVTNKIAGQLCDGISTIKRVTFTGFPPSFTATATKCFTMDEKKATFVIPWNTPEWDAFLAKNASDITWMSAEEIRTAANANPEEPVRVATVGPNVFRSNNTQYLAVSRTALSTVIDYDTAFGDAIDVDYLPDAQGHYPAGVDLTLTAKPNTARGGTFVGWYGNVPGGKCTDASITVRLSPKADGRMPHVFARFTHPWSLVEVEGTSAILSNGVFRINATIDSASHTVKLAKGKACSLYAADNTGTGVLDFGGPITDAADNAYTITGMSGATGCFSLLAGNAYGARVFVSPGTVKTWDPNQNFHATGRKATYETIIIDEPTASGTVVSAWMYSDQNKLKYIILRGENLVINSNTSSGSALDGPFYNSQVKNTDLAWWCLPNTSVGAGQIMHGANQRLYGTLSLDKATFVGKNAFIWDDNLNGLRLGFGKKSSRVTALGETAFKGCTGLTNIVLNAASTLKIGKDCFSGASGVKTVTYLGPAVSEEAFAGILAGVTATEAKSAIVYVSSIRGDWQRATYIDWNVSETEKASAPAGEKVLGVYRGGAASPKGKAWVCDKASPFDPKGLQIIVK